MAFRASLGFGLLLLLAGLVFISSGCRPRHIPVYPPRINPMKAAGLALEMYDADKDGKISGAELDMCPGLKAALAQVNVAGGDYVDYDMIKARIWAWQDARLGRLPVRCSVLRNGKPLPNAVVRFVPEPFLGLDKEKWTATGKTDEKGIALLDIPVETKKGEHPELPGVPPGFYRVEITSPNLAIPAKYNTETVLGQEVALDAKGIAEAIHNGPGFAIAFELAF